MRERRYRRRPERKGMREDNRKKNSGFTLVEVLIAVAILSVVSIPILQSFVSVAQVNAKSRRRLAATTIAEGLMESCKGMSLKEVAAQCNPSLTQSGTDRIPITIVADPGSTTFGGSATEVNWALSAAESNKTVTKSTTAFEFHAKSGGKYAFWIHGIKSGGSSYDAIIKYQLNTTRSKGTIGATTVESTMEAGKVNVMKFYDITIEVYRSAGTLTSLITGDPLVTLEGSVADYSK